MQIRFGLNLATLAEEARRINAEKDAIIARCRAGDWDPAWPASIILDLKGSRQRIVVENIEPAEEVGRLTGTTRFLVTGLAVDRTPPAYGDSIIHRQLTMLQGAGEPFRYHAITDAEGNTDEFVRVERPAKPKKDEPETAEAAALR